MSEPLRFGLIACSSVARRRFLPALRDAGNALLERVGSRDAAAAGALAREFGAAKWGSYEEVLEDPGVEAVYVSTPPAWHGHWVRQAALRGKHVYCEKPAFMDLGEAQAAVELCRSKGVRLMEGYVFRRHPQHARLRELLRAGRAGRPAVFQGEYIYPRPAAGNHRLRREAGGGVFLDAAGYTILAALDAFGETPVSVYGRRHIDPESGVDDRVILAAEYAGGQMSLHLAAFGLQYRSRYSVTGDGGRVEVERAWAIDPDRRARVTLETDAGVEAFDVPPADQFRLTIEEFAAAVRRGGKDRGFEEELLRLQRVMEACRRSCEEGRPMAVAEAAA